MDVILYKYHAVVAFKTTNRPHWGSRSGREEQDIQIWKVPFFLGGHPSGISSVVQVLWQHSRFFHIVAKLFIINPRPTQPFAESTGSCPRVTELSTIDASTSLAVARRGIFDATHSAHELASSPRWFSRITAFELSVARLHGPSSPAVSQRQAPEYHWGFPKPVSLYESSVVLAQGILSPSVRRLYQLHARG
jgi:hypothetical protein